LEAQDRAIQDYVKTSGCTLLGSYTEVETGKRDDLDNRPELVKAIAHAKRSKATLVIAKMDRLARSVYVLATLHRSGVDFVACDNPNVNKMTSQILMVVAEDEAERISQRTKEGLRSRRERGLPLGAEIPESRNLTPEARQRGLNAAIAARQARADAAYVDLVPDILRWRSEGRTLQQIADQLNADGQETSQGGSWQPTQVLRVLKRTESKP
jgi:DNA invertase Pin-like site-specific DNA recombinase